MTTPTLPSRRKFIAATSGLLTLSSLSNYLNAGQLEALKSSFSEVDQRSIIVIYKKNDECAVEFASVFAEAGITTVALGIDPVRQWRDGLSTTLKNKQQIIGLSNWSDYIIMSGLAAEQRRYSMLVAQHKVKQENKNNWASAHALEFLQVSDFRNLQDLQLTHTKDASSKPFSGKSLFSWSIT